MSSLILVILPSNWSVIFPNAFLWRVCVPKWESRISRILRNMVWLLSTNGTHSTGLTSSKGIPFPTSRISHDPTRLSRIISKFSLTEFVHVLFVTRNNYAATLSSGTHRNRDSEMSFSWYNFFSINKTFFAKLRKASTH